MNKQKVAFNGPYRAPEIDGPGHYDFQDPSQQKPGQNIMSLLKQNFQIPPHL